MEAVGEKLAAAYRTQQVSSQIARSVPLLQGALRQMNEIGINKSLDTFQKLFEDMDVKAADMGQSLEGVYQGSLDQKEVDTLIQQVADENKIEIGNEMGVAGKGSVAAPASGAPAKEPKIDDFEARLNNLKQMQN
eukprot:TRINITY_DN407_c0_g1_i3.p1 TRINITY_DN407_c0_g1~~TRINITY_DN407_c0_g1_i3.p1  ORF type:complete len:135 (-),score=39.98 TRINITY_DN407_c0_g1_i3:77-481(-)